ncbi:hypothetical protein ACHAW6_007077 [Cyclotella cf. meneghiniana]
MHTSFGAQQNHANKLKIKLPHKAAHKRATSLYANKLAKPEGKKKMSASEVSKLVLGGSGSSWYESKKRTRGSCTLIGIQQPMQFFQELHSNKTT